MSTLNPLEVNLELRVSLCGSLNQYDIPRTLETNYASSVNFYGGKKIIGFFLTPVVFSIFIFNFVSQSTFKWKQI